MNKTEKLEIVRKLKPKLTKEIAVKDFENLKEIGCDHKSGSTVGNDFVDFYTLPERLETLSKKGFNFYDFWNSKSSYMKKTYIKKILKYYKENDPNRNEHQVWFRIFNLYMGAISIFKPIMAMHIYCMFKPTSILDMTMGWGGRLVGACALDIPNYTGIDLNYNLKKPYEMMCEELNKHSKTKIKLYFQDALTFDYSKIKYDMVLTSPPYYNIELYSGTKQMTEDEWNNKFYMPLFEKSYKYLSNGGHYCLNIPQSVYNDVAVKVLGKAKYFVPMYKMQRKKGEQYKEYIYVWVKNEKTGGGGDEYPSLPKATYKNEWVEAKKSKIAGYGNFAKKDIPDGTKIADFIGDEMTMKEFKKKYGKPYAEMTELHPYSYVMRRIHKIIVSSNPKYFTKNVVNYTNEIPPNFNVVLKQRALYAIKNIKKGEELSLEYPKDYHRYWLEGKGKDDNADLEKLLFKLTPIEKMGDNYLKRDDYFEYAGQRGGKVRSALYIMTRHKTKGITTAGNRNSPQINIVSSIGKKLNIPVYAFTSTGELGDEVKLAKEKGANIIQVPVGYETNINHKAKLYSNKHNFIYVPFGMDTEDAHILTSNQVKNIPDNIKRIVVPVGSASSIIGIIEGVKKYKPHIKIIGVVVGANPLRKLNKYVPDWEQYATLEHSKLKYSTPAPVSKFGDLQLDPYYEAKTIPFIKKGDLLWIVGVRESI